MAVLRNRITLVVQWMQNTLLYTPRVRTQLQKLVAASESPAGFMALAAVGVLAVMTLHLSGPTAPQSIPPEPHTPVPAVKTNALEPVSMHTESEKALLTPQEPMIETLTLRRGETLGALLNRAKIDSRSAHGAIAALKDVTNMRKLRAGQAIRLKRTASSNDVIAELRIRDAFEEEAVTTRNDKGYHSYRAPLKTYSLTHLVEGTISDSLYLSAKNAGLPDKVIIDLIRLLSFDVDFEREIRTGDKFRVYFERSYAPSFQDINEGQILHAELELRRRTLEAFLYTDEHGEKGYFDSQGISTRRALMKTPLDVAVITSSYGKRKHPVLGYTRMHAGVDFRAPTGTPIMASGDGVVEMAARNGSYGNYVRIRHNGSYKTAYAHLSRYGRGIKKGKRVKQGQVIGYSGATGRVTAAHLHYEVMLNGKQVNPMTLKLPTGRKLTVAEMQGYQQHRETLLADIEQARSIKTLLYAGRDTDVTAASAAR